MGQPVRRRDGAFLAVVMAVLVLLVAALGVVVGHAVWKSASNTNGSGGSFFGGVSPSVPSGSGQGSSASGGPANAASIARSVEAGVVDVNTQVGFDQTLEGAGTGMVLAPNGVVLTNNHVIETATHITVTDIGNGKRYSASVIGYDRSHDVAVLQLSGASGLSTVKIGDSSKVTTGQGVVAIGNANGSGGTPSYASGSIAALNQSITASDEANGASEQLTGLIETNADIIAGDSGGPLVNTSGEVVGVDTASSAGGGGFQFQSPANEGFAIPINEAMNAARQIQAGHSSGSIHLGPTAFLGVEVQSPGSVGGGLFGGGSSPTTSGAQVAEVISGGPADQAGLQVGDTLTSLAGRPVSSPDALTNAMLQQKPGAHVQVQFIDNSGNRQTVTVTLGSGPPQ